MPVRDDRAHSSHSLALRIDRAAEFAAPDDERVVQHAALLEVLDEGRA